MIPPITKSVIIGCNMMSPEKIPEKYFIYNLMKYIKPIWYFHINPYDGEKNVWIQYNQLSSEDKKTINYDKKYSSRALSNLDASYQALMKGMVKQTGNYIQTDEIELVPADIYRFIRKYYKKILIC